MTKRHLSSCLAVVFVALPFTMACAEKPGAKEDPANASTADPAASKPADAKAAPEDKPKAMPQPGDLPAPPDVAAAPADAKKTESGIAYKVLTAGTGSEHPKATDKVKVHYTGWQTDGKMFDSSHKRGAPAVFPLNRVIKGWTEGVQLMVPGEKTRFGIPAELAYGDTPRRPGAPSGMLVFDVELLEIMKPIEAPKDVAAAPKDAKKTASGLAYKHLKPGDGPSPTAEDTVKVHYTGWTTDGKMFDSSVERGQPTEFPLKGVIKGWTEGVQLMKKGGKTRFWIPGSLGYGEGPRRPGGPPTGTLVFDVELLEIKGK